MEFTYLYKLAVWKQRSSFKYSFASVKKNKKNRIYISLQTGCLKTEIKFWVQLCKCKKVWSLREPFLGARKMYVQLYFPQKKLAESVDWFNIASSKDLKVKNKCAVPLFTRKSRKGKHTNFHWLGHGVHVQQWWREPNVQVRLR